MNTGRLIEICADLLMDLAMRIGRVSEMFDRVSKSLHEQAMRDLATAIVHELDDIDDGSDAGGEAVPDLSQQREVGQPLLSTSTESWTVPGPPSQSPIISPYSATGRTGTRHRLEAAASLGAALRSEYGEFSRSRSFDREHEQEQRADRGWQRLGDVANQVVKAAVVTGAIRGYIPRPVASEIVASKKLRDA